MGKVKPIFYIKSPFNHRSREMGLDHSHKNFAKKVPKWVFSASLEHKAACIRGYYLTDGGTSVRTVSFTSVSYQLLKGIQRLCYSLAIRTTLKRVTEGKNGNRDVYRLFINPEDRIKLWEIVSVAPCNKERRLKAVCHSDTNKGNYLPPRLAQRVALEWRKTWIKLKSQTPEYNRRHAMFTKMKNGAGSLDFARKLPLSEETLELLSYSFLRVDKVTDCKRRVEMFDLTVEPSHQYASWNGAIMHNSGQDLLKASIVRTDWRRVNPDRALPQHMDMPRSHRLLLKDYARRLEKIRRLLKLAHCNFALQVHDERIDFIDKEAAEECSHLIGEVMCWKHYFPPIVKYNTALVVDGGVGVTWQQAKGKKEKPLAKIEVRATYL